MPIITFLAGNVAGLLDGLDDRVERNLSNT